MLAWSVVVLGACGGTVEVIQPLPNGSGPGDESQAVGSHSQLEIIGEYSESGAYFTVRLSDAGPLDGVHGAWCVDPDTSSAYGPYPVQLYSSYAALPSGVVENPDDFDLVNYNINNFEVGETVVVDLGEGIPTPTTLITLDVQDAIWGLMSSSYYVGDGSVAQALIEAARAEGEGFLPACDQQMAVIALPIANQDHSSGNDVQVLAPVVPVSPDGCP